MNCFLCHLTQPNNPARITAIQAGHGEWAATATLLGTGIVDALPADGAYTWNPAAFYPEGELAPALCHHPGSQPTTTAPSATAWCTPILKALALTGCSLDNWQTATTGQVISGQKISISGMNLAGKASLARSWDIHAERGLTCTDCHYALNNPAYYQSGADNARRTWSLTPAAWKLASTWRNPTTTSPAARAPRSPWLPS